MFAMTKPIQPPPRHGNVVPGDKGENNNLNAAQERSFRCCQIDDVYSQTPDYDNSGIFLEGLQTS